MEPTLNATLPPPPSSAAVPSASPVSSSQPTDQKEEFPKALASAQTSVAPRGGPTAPPPPRPAVAASQPGAPVSGNVLPLTGALGRSASAAAGDERDGGGDGPKQDGADLLWSWPDSFSLAPQPVGVPLQPVLTIAVGLAGSPPLASRAAGFSAAPESDRPTLDGPGAAAEHGDAMASLLLTANAMRASAEPQTTAPWDPALLPAVTPDVGGLRSADAASGAPPATRAADAGPLGEPFGLPVGQPGWGRELGSRVLWLAKDNQQYAELRLNPPHLGPLEVRISLQQDQGASLSFLSSHAAVRDAIAGALPQLREMLADGGFTLLDVNVSHHSPGGGQSGAAPWEGQGPRAMGTQEATIAADNEVDGQRRVLPIQGVSRVDYFV